MKKTIAILLLLCSSAAVAQYDSGVYELQREIKMLKMNQAITDRYITALENRIAALEGRSSSSSKKMSAEEKAMFDNARKRIQASEARTKAYEQPE